LKPGRSTLSFRRSGTRTVLAQGLAASPLRILMPRNHGDFSWVFLASLGGGLVDGDDIDVDVDVGEGARALLGTQACTKVYRSPRGCTQQIRVRVACGGVLAVLPDPVICFKGARYAQRVHVSLSASASIAILDGYLSGRRARGERWEFARYSSRTTVEREGSPLVVDATVLDGHDGCLSERMSRFNALMSLTVAGPAMTSLRGEMLDARDPPAPGSPAISASSPIGNDGAILRICAERTDRAMELLQPTFARAAELLGDNPFARKW
jgi:urease accessory protein